VSDGATLGATGAHPAGAGGGSLTDRTLAALGLGGGLTPAQRMIITALSTTTTTTAAMAFLFFGKRRRDGAPPAPDEVLAANAARMSMAPSATLVPAFGSGLSTNPGFRPDAADDEASMPRWRRPSLMAARKADPLRTVTVDVRLSFDNGVVGPIDGHERRRIRYRLVRLLDAPDELRSSEIGFLDQGDEVQLLERSGAYWLVLCPDGGRGWVHKMTLGDIDDPADDVCMADASNDRSFAQATDDLDADILGTYIRMRHQS
jgi:hypothetical protein